MRSEALHLRQGGRSRSELVEFVGGGAAEDPCWRFCYESVARQSQPDDDRAPAQSPRTFGHRRAKRQRPTRSNRRREAIMTRPPFADSDHARLRTDAAVASFAATSHCAPPYASVVSFPPESPFHRPLERWFLYSQGLYVNPRLRYIAPFIVRFQVSAASPWYLRSCLAHRGDGECLGPKFALRELSSPPVTGFTPSQMAKENAACSTSMPSPSLQTPAPHFTAKSRKPSAARP